VLSTHKGDASKRANADWQICQPPFECFPAEQPSGSAQKRTALDQVVNVRALAPSLPEMSKAAREAAFDEERNDALRQSVGLLFLGRFVTPL